MKNKNKHKERKLHVNSVRKVLKDNKVMREEKGERKERFAHGSIVQTLPVFSDLKFLSWHRLGRQSGLFLIC